MSPEVRGGIRPYAPRQQGVTKRVHVVGRLLLLPAGERGAVFLSTEDGASAEVRSRAATWPAGYLDLLT